MIRMTRLLLPLAAVALLAGCSGPPSIADETGVDVPDALASDQVIGESGPGAAWHDGRTSFVVVVYGSSSCAPIPTTLTVEGPSLLVLDFAQNPSEACTADMAANTFRFDTPENVASDGEVELAMTFEYNGETSTSTVPIVD